MERFFITKDEKKDVIKKYPTLECENSIGIYYNNEYFSVKCKILSGTCTYKNGCKDEFKNCKYLNK